MNYWPSYSEIAPICRATYLDWLASDRSDASYNAGYMFLFFYGLERRFFIDQPTEDEKREILEEVIRLAGIYSGSGSAQRYLGQFIQVAQVALHDPRASEPTFSHRGFELPLSLKMAIGAKLAQLTGAADTLARVGMGPSPSEEARFLPVEIVAETPKSDCACPGGCASGTNTSWPRRSRSRI